MQKILVALLFFYSTGCMASEARILEVQAELTSAQKFNFIVTVKHADTGWDHYADAWRIYTPEGELIAERVLHHPHVDEQPFKRNLMGVRIPQGANELILKASCSKTGESKNTYTLKIQ